MTETEQTQPIITSSTATPEYSFNEADVRNFYKWLRHNPNEWTEIRAIAWYPDSRGESSPYYVNNEEDFIKTCRFWNGKRHVYVGINPRITKKKEGEGGKAEDIKRVTTIEFDVDGPHPTDKAASDLEIQVAEDWKNQVQTHIKEQLNIEPYVDFSGNGYHIALPCDLNTDRQGQIDMFFKEYKQALKIPEFDNMTDLPRVIKVPGTWSLKGYNTPNRPHRQAYIIQLGDTTPETIKKISDHILSLEAPEKKTITNQNSINTILDQVKINQLRPCFRDFITNPQRNRVCYDPNKDERNTETGLRKALVLEMHFAEKTFSKDEKLLVCQKFDDYDQIKSSYEIDLELNNLTPEIKPWTCESIQKNGGCLNDKCPIYNRKNNPSSNTPSSLPKQQPSQETQQQSEQEKDGDTTESKEKKTGKQPPKEYFLGGISNNGPFEAIYQEDDPAFLVKTKSGFQIQETVMKGQKTFYAPEKKSYPYEAYTYQPTQQVIIQQLYKEVFAEIDQFIDVEPIQKHVITSAILLTYQQRKMQTVPYLFPYGDNESGKTTILNVMNVLSYRPLFGTTIPTADLFGYLRNNDEPGCILEDEIQGINKDTDKIKIYKSGYKRGAKVPRVKTTATDKYIEYFETFCFKVCGGEQIPQVKGFRERFIEIPMVEGYPKKEWTDIDDQDFKRFQNLRNRLLLWKLNTYDQPLPPLQLNFRGRLKEIWKPLLQVTEGLDGYTELLEYVKTQSQQRLEIRQNTLDGHIVKVIVENIPSKHPWTFSAIWTLLIDELDGKIDDKKPNKIDTAEFGEVTKQKIGYRLREILTGDKKTIREGTDNKTKAVKAYSFNLEKLQRIAKKYGYEDGVTNVTKLLEAAKKENEDNQKIVTELPSEPTSEGKVNSMIIKNKEESMGKASFLSSQTPQKQANTPQKLDKLGNLVTDNFVNIDLNKVAYYVALKKEDVRPDQPCSVCQQNKPLAYTYRTYESKDGYVCFECGDKIRCHLDGEG
jgi:hypothetical protein